MNFYKHNTEFSENNQDLRIETEDVLKDIRRNGKEFDWRGKKIKSRYYADILDILHFKKAKNVKDCADEMAFKVGPDNYLRLHQVWFCKSKLCPLCAWRRSMKFSYQNQEIISEAMKKYPTARFLFLTLTVKNVYGGEELNKVLKEMTSGFNRLFKYKKVAKNMVGFLRATEVTVNDTDHSYHPHFHVLLMVKPTYFKGSENYLSQDEWTKLWQKSMKLDYQPIVNIKAVRGKSKDKKDVQSAVLESSKYPVKDSDYLTDDMDRDSAVVDDLEMGLHRKRQIGYGLLFKELRKKLHLDDAEEGDLRVVGADDEDEIDESAQIIYAKWNNDRKNYFIKR